MAISSPVYDPEKEKTKKPDGSHDKRDMTDEERRAEIDDLEKQFAAPSAETEGTEGSDVSTENIAEAEKAGDDAPVESDQVGKGYTGGKTSRRKITGKIKSLSGRQKAVGGGVIGILIAGGIGFSTLVSGPLQFIHIAQLLQKFHFASAQDDGNSRLLKLYKWSKNARQGTPENTRLGIVGRRVALKIDGRLANIGIEKQYSRIGTYNGTTIDPIAFSENSDNGASFKRLGEEDFINKFQEDFGIKISYDSSIDKFKVDEDGFFSAYFKNRALNKMLVRQAGYDNIPGTVAARIMGVRDKVTWHPIERLDSKLTGTIDEKFAAWLKKIKERIKNGDAPKLNISGDTDAEDPDGNPDQDKIDSTSDAADNTSELADDVTDEIARNEEDIATGAAKSTDEVGSGVISKLTKSTAGKVGLSATAVIGLACAANGIAKAADGLKHDLVVLPLVRTGVQAMSVGNQVMSGQDLDITQLSFFAKQLNDPKTGSWASARSIQAELGQEANGPDIPDAANIGKISEGNMFSQIFDQIPQLDTICAATSSGIGGFVMKVVDIATGPVGFVSGEIVAKSGILEGPINSLIRWIAGSPIPTYVTGPTYGNYINYGARLAANDQFASMGGAKLSNTQSAELKNYNMYAQKQDLQSKSLAQRVFDPYSSDSLVGKAIDNVSPNTSSNVASFLSNLGNPSKLMAILKLPFSQKISAASNYDYGFPEVGFSLDDMNSAEFENPYDNASRAISKLRSSESYRNRIEKCFGMKFDPNSTDGGLTTQFSSIDVLKDEYDDNNCDDKSSDWTSVRFYVFDMKTIEATDCFETGDSQSCQNTGFGGTGSQTPVTSEVQSNGLVSPPNIGPVLSNNYYRMPDAPNGEYEFNGNTPASDRCGSKTLVDTIYTVATKWYAKYPNSKLRIGDLNAASGHASHKNGVDVDIFTVDRSAANTGGNAEKSKELGHMFADTGKIKKIFYNDTSVQADFNAYVKSKGLSGNMEFWPGHNDHFHVRIADEFRLATSLGCPAS